MIGDEERQKSIELLTEAYARGRVSDSMLEDKMLAIQKAQDASELEAVFSGVRTDDLVEKLELSTGVQDLVGEGQSFVKKGRWFDSRKIHVVQKGSSFVLDFRELGRFRNLTLELEFDIIACTCLVRLPHGMEIVDRTQGRQSSARVTTKGENQRKLRVILTGVVAQSTLRVKTKRRY